ncbi:hypothetical protein BDV95DRAFT_8699 [Massariosphaeria phaeospora]|uniref:Asl1-like glycosyl hydrolase catalytic domain-containing protein n=1 Tax=Massariosphaeria phaeospora TaxID=100035 RepID=A0A7C8IHV8_9PLEO|nr:hypothetical protein BDV95DRAFT_8699 [Massariosphaeria phaeospora]
MQFLTLILSLFLAVFSIAAPLEPQNESNLKGLDLQGLGPNKRGIAYNDPGITKLFPAPGSKVSWMWNWDSWTENAQDGYEYVPMLWSDHPDKTSQWEKHIDFWVHVGPGLTHVMSFNEPDQCGNGGAHACMQDIDRTVSAHIRWIEPLRKYGDKIKLGSPAVTNGHQDPATGQKMGLDYLGHFLDWCIGCKIDFINIHWYGNHWEAEQFKQFVRDARGKADGRAIWITEFGLLTANDEEKKSFLGEVLPWLDEQGDVDRYCFFWAVRGQLVREDGRGLSAHGQFYNTS